MLLGATWLRNISYISRSWCPCSLMFIKIYSSVMFLDWSMKISYVSQPSTYAPRFLAEEHLSVSFSDMSYPTMFSKLCNHLLRHYLWNHKYGHNLPHNSLSAWTREYIVPFLDGVTQVAVYLCLKFEEVAIAKATPSSDVRAEIPNSQSSLLQKQINCNNEVLCWPEQSTIRPSTTHAAMNNCCQRWLASCSAVLPGLTRWT
jgi:hypothetical protein